MTVKARLLTALAASALVPTMALADAPSLSFGSDLGEPVAFKRPSGAGGGGGGSTPPPPTFYSFGNDRAAVYEPWMHVEVPSAWSANASAANGYDYLGQGVAITFVDDFNSGDTFAGNLDGTQVSLTHGYWTSTEGGMVAPNADIYGKDFSTSQTAVSLQSANLNVFNASYGWIEFDTAWTGSLDPQEQSLVDLAAAGAAVLSKSAGNDYGAAVGDGKEYMLVGGGKPKTATTYDYFAKELIQAAIDNPDTFSGIFVGALDANSTEVWSDGATYTGPKVGIASYSTVAGDITAVQDHFVVVGVRNDLTGLAGTSFAAPVISAYAAILGSKFQTATATQVANRLLSTARTDTLVDIGPAGYGAEDRAIYGMGEASIYRAMAADSIQ